MNDTVSSNTTFHGKPNAPHAAPSSFHKHAVIKHWSTKHPRADVWAWLNNPKTFSKGQIPPWRVEFVSAEPDIQPGFHVGGLNVHHGPFTLFSGTMTEIRDGEYRDLQYFYGSHFLSLRLVRPTRLQFWLEDSANGGTIVRLQLDTLVRGYFLPLWKLGNSVFWASFGRWLNRLKQYD